MTLPGVGSSNHIWVEVKAGHNLDIKIDQQRFGAIHLQNLSKHAEGLQSPRLNSSVTKPRWLTQGQRINRDYRCIFKTFINGIVFISYYSVLHNGSCVLLCLGQWTVTSCRSCSLSHCYLLPIPLFRETWITDIHWISQGVVNCTVPTGAPWTLLSW